MNVPVCRRCLLDELTHADLYRTVEEYILSIPDERRASPEINAQRLSVCQDCDELIDGMCAQCGCYVQARAAKKDGRCPHKKW